MLFQEVGWFVLNSGTPVQATKADFLSVLADIEVKNLELTHSVIINKWIMKANVVMSCHNVDNTSFTFV